MRCAILFAAVCAVFAQSPGGWTPELTLQLKNVGAVTPSPDGRMLVWTETRQVLDTDKSEVSTQLWTGAVDGSKRRQLTRHEKSSNAPAWSPDGQWVYFLSARGPKRQVYRIAIAGGEAEQVTDSKGSISEFELSPDGATLAYASYETPAEKEKAKKEKRDYVVVGEDPENESLYLLPLGAEKPAAKKLTDGKRHTGDFAWAPDGKTIALVHWPSPGADDWTKGELAEVDVASSAWKSLGRAESFRGNKPLYSPDGRFLAYTRAATVPAKWAFQSRIVLLDRRSGQARELPATYDDQPSMIGWTADSSRLLFSEAKRTRTAIFAMPVDGPPQQVFEPARGIVNGVRLNAKATHYGFAHETPEMAVEAYAMPVGGASPVRVSAANTGLAKPEVPKTEVVRWKSKDGMEVEGVLTYPLGYEKGKKYPLILNIHGGPTGVFNENYVGRAALYPIAVFAARGYLVLRPNPRGSSGYGQPFRFANYNDWGGKDFEDDQAGVDLLIAQGVADAEKLAVMGWSYGGYMTNWTITQTTRFKAAAAGAGLSNLWSFTGTADVLGFIPDYFGGEPYQAFDRYQKHSPITHVKNVTTPTLFLHGQLDDRVPLGQAHEMYHALRQRGVATKLVEYPRTPHGPSEPKFVLDIMQRHLDWVDKYVR